MAFNDSVSWYIGKNGQTILPKGKRVQQIESGIKKFGPLALFVWSIIPFPYDLIGLISGYLGVSYLGFFIPTFLGKFLRFILLGTGTVSIFGKTN
jgi:membrane protein YqaA with SNARE-associated domain